MAGAQATIAAISGWMPTIFIGPGRYRPDCRALEKGRATSAFSRRVEAKFGGSRPRSRLAELGRLRRGRGLTRQDAKYLIMDGVG